MLDMGPGPQLLRRNLHGGRVFGSGGYWATSFLTYVFCFCFLFVCFFNTPDQVAFNVFVSLLFLLFGFSNKLSSSVALSEPNPTSPQNPRPDPKAAVGHFGLNVDPSFASLPFYSPPRFVLGMV